MSAFRVNVVAVNPKNEDVVTEPISALVDTGSELTWLPGGELTAAGITPRRTRTFITASGERLQREVGYAIVRAEGYETTDEVVFGEKGDQLLLGVRTLEGFAVTVDPIGHRLAARGGNRRRTGSGEAPGWQGATNEHIDHMGARSSAASRDGSPLECSRCFATGC